MPPCGACWACVVVEANPLTNLCAPEDETELAAVPLCGAAAALTAGPFAAPSGACVAMAGPFTAVDGRHLGLTAPSLPVFVTGVKADNRLPACTISRGNCKIIVHAQYQPLKKVCTVSHFMLVSALQNPKEN